jgi:glycosyltransferase involved in cell wall biosynthesis
MSSNSFPRISIVTPSYNQGQFLDKTIQSVLTQDYPNVEYIVIDGGSTDSSVEIIHKYADRLAYWVSEKDKGQSDAINKGFRRATGTILAWLNSDDLYCPGALSRAAQFFRGHPACGAVIGDLGFIDNDGRAMYVKKAVPVNFRRTLYSGCAVPEPAAFYTRGAWEATGDLDVGLHYLLDYEYFLRMQARGVRFGLVKAPLAQFRLHADSKTVSEYQRSFWADFGRVQDRYLKTPFHGTSREYYRQAMKWLYRLQIYLLRAVTRGTIVPFRGTRARKRALRGAHPDS